MLGYELLYIISSSIKEQEVESSVKTIEEKLKSKGAKILHHNGFPLCINKTTNNNLLIVKEPDLKEEKDNLKNYTKRNLIYPVKGESFGYYVLCYFKMNPQKVADFKDSLFLNKQILRFNLLKLKNIEQKLKIYLTPIKRVIEKQNKLKIFPLAGAKYPQPKEITQKVLSVKPKTVYQKVTIQEKLKGKIDLETIDKELENILQGGEIEID